jgi:hypothetical protein
VGVVRTHIIISFGTFGAATLHIIAVCGPGNGSQRCMGANAQKTSLEPSVPWVQRRGNRASVVDGDELVIAQEPGRCLCCHHGRVKAVCDGRTIVLFSRRFVVPSFIYDGVLCHVTEKLRRFLLSLPSSSCLSLQDDRSGALHLGNTCYGLRRQRQRQRRKRHPSLPSQVGDYFE